MKVIITKSSFCGEDHRVDVMHDDGSVDTSWISSYMNKETIKQTYKNAEFVGWEDLVTVQFPEEVVVRVGFIHWLEQEINRNKFPKNHKYRTIEQMVEYYFAENTYEDESPAMRLLLDNNIQLDEVSMNALRRIWAFKKVELPLYDNTCEAKKALIQMGLEAIDKFVKEELC